MQDENVIARDGTACFANIDAKVSLIIKSKRVKSEFETIDTQNNDRIVI